MEHEYNDHVICSRCGAEQIVEKGSDVCLDCHYAGTLQWCDENHPEINSPPQILSGCGITIK